MMPGLISAGFLMGFGYEITYPVEVDTITSIQNFTYLHINSNDTVIQNITTTETITEDKKIEIDYSNWSNFHLMIFLTFFIWIVYQIFQLFQRIR